MAQDNLIEVLAGEVTASLQQCKTIVIIIRVSPKPFSNKYFAPSVSLWYYDESYLMPSTFIDLNLCHLTDPKVQLYIDVYSNSRFTDIVRSHQRSQRWGSG